MKNVRESNFEFMRIVSMIFIIMCHVIDSGNVIKNCQNETLSIIFELIMFFTRVHVNSFMLLSGFFQSKSKFKLKKVINLFLQGCFYIVLLFCVALKLHLIESINAMTIIKLFLPSSLNDYWFITAYIITYIFSDYINIFINRLSRKEHKNFIIVGFIVLSILSYISGLRFINNNGFNFYHFIYLYIVGAYLRKYPLKHTYHFKIMKQKNYFIFMIFIFISMAMLNYMIALFANRIQGVNSIFNYLSENIIVTKYCYSNPIVIIQSVAYFEVFGCLRFKNKTVNYVSSNVLGIYFFHENLYVRQNIYKLLKIDNGIYYSYRKFVHYIFVILFIFLFGLLIEIIRKSIQKTIDKLINGLRSNFND